MSTETVLNHHLGAFGSGDLDELMSDYTDDSILIAPEQTLRGVDEIRGLFASFFEGLFRPGTYEFTLNRAEVVGDVAFIVWQSTNEGASVKLGTDTYVIRDGKIAVQTFAALVE